MSGHGINRSPYQVLPESGEKITCVEINDHHFRTHDWFMESIRDWPMPDRFFGHQLKIYMDKGSWDRWVSRDWDFVLVAPLTSVRSYHAGNDGMQAWRHRRTGFTIPDHCRQTGGCPEMWSSGDVKGKRELKISNLHDVEDFVVIDHRQVTRSAFPEHAIRRATPTSWL